MGEKVFGRNYKMNSPLPKYKDSDKLIEKDTCPKHFHKEIIGNYNTRNLKL